MSHPAAPRRRIRPRNLSTRQSVLDWTAILLLLSAPTIGVLLFGAVRFWSSGFLMVPVFTGMILFLLRPFMNRGLLEMKIPPGGLAFVAVLLYTLLWYPFSDVPYENRMELLKMCSYLGAYWAWTELAAHHKRWRIILLVVMLLATLVASYALVQHANGSRMVLHLERHEQYGMRASGTFRAPAHFGAYLGMLIPLSISLIGIKQAGPLLRMLSVYGLMLFLPAIALSGSRSGWVGAAAGTLVVAGLIAARHSLRRAALILVGLPVVTLLLFGALWMTVPPVQEQISDALHRKDSVNFRLDAWRDTLVMIQDRPLFGHGPGQYRWSYPPYKTWKAHRWLMEAHNEYLHTAAEYGLIGLGLFAAGVGAVALRLLRLYRRLERNRDAHLVAGFLGTLAAALGHALTDFNLHVFALVHLLILLGGVTAAVLFDSRLLQPHRVSSGRWMGIGGTGIAACVLLAGLALQSAWSDGAWRIGAEKEERINFFSPEPYGEAQTWHHRAIRIDSRYAPPYLSLGDIARKEMFWIQDPAYRKEKAETALRYYEKAYERNPLDSDILFGLGRTWFELGHADTSIDFLMRAHAHWPTHPYYPVQTGLQLRQQGKVDEALEIFYKARELEPGNPVIQTNIRLLERARDQQPSRERAE